MKNGASKLLQSLDFGPIGVTNHRLFRMFKSPSIVTMESFANCWKQLTTPKDFWSSGPVLDIFSTQWEHKRGFFPQCHWSKSLHTVLPLAHTLGVAELTEPVLDLWCRISSPSNPAKRCTCRGKDSSSKQMEREKGSKTPLWEWPLPTAGLRRPNGALGWDPSDLVGELKSTKAHSERKFALPWSQELPVKQSVQSGKAAFPYCRSRKLYTSWHVDLGTLNFLHNFFFND